ncbi:MAG: trigger factor family protein, partial [Phycisphaerae bacterium]
MAEATENNPPQETATEESVPIDVTVEDAGVCKKKLVITVPRDRIDAKFDERFTELEREAQVPGFRPGHAPRRLIEKRFRRPVADEVRVALVTEAFEKAVEQEKLDVIGEPDLDPEQIELPEEGEMSFSVELEVRPEFELPDYKGIPVDAERPEITDEQVEDALKRLRESHGSLEPLTKNQKAK